MATISDIQQEARDLVDADTNSYPAATLLRRCNAAYEEIVSLILRCDGLWQFDDSNFTTFPRATATLVAGQQDYTFDSSVLEVEGVSVKDSSGIWQKLIPIDDQELGVDPAEFLKDDGLPRYYDKQGRSLLLYPAPASGSVTLASGLKVFFKRTADLFTSAQVTTGTKEPGFASPFHYVLSYMAALPYAESYKKDRVQAIILKIEDYKKQIKAHYGQREQDRRKQFTMRGISFR